MRMDRFYWRIGDRTIVRGWEGFLVFMFVERTWDVIRPALPLAIGYAIGSVLGLLTGGPGDSVARLIVFMLVVMVCFDLMLLNVYLKWKEYRRKGYIAPLPKWQNWRRS